MAQPSLPIIVKDIEIMSESIKALKEEISKHLEEETLRHKEFQDFKEALFDRLDTKYAGKWTEKLIVGIGSAIGLALIGAFMALILK